MALRKYPGLFSLRDASLGLGALALPRRFIVSDFSKRLARETEITEIEPNLRRVRLKSNGLVFYCQDPITPNLYYAIQQEFDSRCPHYYTTPPVRLSPRSRILDVGACEGLFAYRALKEGCASEVICFEPAKRTAQLTRDAAVENGFAGRIRVEEFAVGKQSGPVRFVFGDSATSHRVEKLTGDSAAGKDEVVQCITLDEYCASKNLRLCSEDLIKIDAEGFDFDILLGAERIIREGAPQISVTTYHKDSHVDEIVGWLKQLRPDYKLRLKGFSHWTDRPRPVLLQASAIQS
jgi:FkbM family methyltransferase